MTTGNPPFHHLENQFIAMINIAEAKIIDIPSNISLEQQDFLKLFIFILYFNKLFFRLCFQKNARDRPNVK